MKRERGFTLLELMITLAVGGLLLSMAVPALQSFTNNAKRSSAVNDFVSSMHLARNTAITTNSRVTICASSNAQSCEGVPWDSGWIVFKDANSNRSVDDGEVIVSASEGLDRVTLRSGEFGSFIMFRPNGRAMNASVNGNFGQFMVCDSRGAEHARVVIVELSGRPRLSDHQADGQSPVCAESII
jgi:type IV fimbrial biogenesis protein FimT